MTLSPFTSRLVKPRPDLPAYPLNGMCAHPACTLRATDNHHLLNRGMGGRGPDYWWAELPNAKRVPVRVGLCAGHHRDVTEHRARIKFERNHGAPFYMWWQLRGEGRHGPLDPQPPFDFLYLRVCSDCGRRSMFRTCDYCMGETIAVGESPVGREDRLAAEGHA